MDRDELFLRLEKALAARDSFLLNKYAKNLLELVPHHPKAYYYLAEAALMNWDYNKAVQHLEVAIKHNPKEFFLRKKYALAKLNNGNEKEAVRLYEALIKEQPENADLYYDLGKFYTQNWNPEKAISNLKKVAELKPDHPEVYTYLIETFQSAKRYEEALEYLDKAIQQDSKNVEWYKARIKINKRQKDVDACERDYEQLVYLSGDNDAKVRLEFGDLYAEFGLYPQAEKQYTILIDSEEERGEPKNGAHYRKRGETRLRMANYQLALEDLEVALELNPKDGSLYYFCAKAQHLQGDKMGALEKLVKGMPYKPKQLIEMQELAGRISMDQEDWYGAKVQFETMSKTSGVERQGFFLLGLMHRKKGELEEAHKNWTIAKKHGHPQAQDMIDKYCDSVIDDKDGGSPNNFEGNSGPETDRNAASAFLRKLFGKHWGLDKDMTMEKSLTFKRMPEFLKKSIFEMIESLAFTISPQSIVLVNPIRQNMHAYYRILSETRESIEIAGKRQGAAANEKEIKLNLSFYQNRLKVEGMMPGMGSEVLYFVETNPKKVNPKEEQERIDRLADNAKNLLTNVFSDLLDKFKK